MKYKYSYLDYSKAYPPIKPVLVFETILDKMDIIEADRIFTENTKINPIKAPYIGCSINKI